MSSYESVGLVDNTKFFDTELGLKAVATGMTAILHGNIWKELGTTVNIVEHVTQQELLDYLDNSGKQGMAVIKSGHNKWGLNSRDWNLRKAACDYYLLLLATLYDEDKYSDYSKYMTDRLVTQFTRYTDMAIGGEIRHMTHRTHLPTRLRHALADGTLANGRNSAWEGWYWLRKRYGTVALRWIVKAYNEGFRWKSGYGGEPWGNIAKTLLLWEEGKISDTVFVDTCWGLQHNGGKYFDKWWSTGGLQYSLDSNQEGNYCALIPQASTRVRQLITKEMMEAFCSCGNH